LLGHTNVTHAPHYFEQFRILNKYFKSETKQTENVIAQNVKKWE